MARVEMTIDSLRQDLLHYEWVLLLKDKVKERYLPICIGSSQADIIKGLLIGTEPAEPVDYDFSGADINSSKSEPRSIIISRFKDNVFHAKLLLTGHNRTYKVDCPPAKAIAIAIKSEVPIFAEEKLLTKVAIDVPTPNKAIQ